MRKPATPKTQGERFIEAARELGCDESEEGFDAKLKTIASQPPKPVSEIKAPRRKKKHKAAK